MNVSPSDEMADALDELRKYLSDALPPLLAVDSIQQLMAVHPDLLVREIVAWAESQCSFRGAAKLSDFLYHSIRKIHMLGEYQLISQVDLESYLKHVSPHLIAYCPPESRSALESSVQRLVMFEGGGRSIDKQAEVVYRLASDQAGAAGAAASGENPPEGSSGAAAAGGPAAPSRPEPGASLPSSQSAAGGSAGAGLAFPQAAASDSFSQFMALMAEIKEAGAPAAAGGAPRTARPAAAAPEQQQELVLQLLAAAARNAHTAQQLEEHLKQVRSMGIHLNTTQVMQQLAEGIPNYALTAPADAGPEGTASAPGHYANSRVQAMQKMVELAGSRAETSNRFKTMVNLAVDQLNQGALARAVAILDSARELISGGKPEKSAIDAVRSKGHERVDFERLVRFAGESTQKSLLHRFLSFFNTLAPTGLLRQIKEEDERERRLSLLSLMEAHGDEGRQEILSELDRMLHEGVDDLKDPQFFQRNLLHILNRVPCSSEKLYEKEMDILTQLSKSRLTKEVLRELIRNISRYKDSKAESALVLLMNQLQNSINQLTRDNAPRLEIDDLNSLMDRIMTALAGFETKKSHKIVLDYCLAEKAGIRRNPAPLAALGEQNLSPDPDSVQRLTKALVKEIPSKLFGIFQKKDKSLLLALVNSLAQTPADDVKQAFQQLLERDPESEAGRTAARLMDDFASLAESRAKPPAAEEPAVLSGELKTFDLPTMLQYLETAGTSGLVSLSDSDGTVCARVQIEAGKMKACKAGNLKGVDALYYLLEKPLSGRFVLTGIGSAVPADLEMEDKPVPLTWVLMEGVRRYDEYRQACTMIPNGSRLLIKAPAPPPVEEEKDEDVLKTIWSMAGSGLPPEEIEARLAADPYRIRRCLCDWFTKGALAVDRAA